MTITKYFVILSATPLSLAHHAKNDNAKRIASYANLATFRLGALRKAPPN